jgi:hypothetical protein
MFNSILTGSTSTLSIASVLICMLVSVICGIIIALVYRKCQHASKSFLLTIAMLPAIVMAVILMVNGNLGVGVAVAGSFSLVRFRSLPGRASDILVIFLSMAVGLVTGMGYAVFALILSIVLSIAIFVLSKISFLDADPVYRNIRINIPEDLDYTNVFSDVFAQYTSKATVESVRTINLGTMYQIEYDVELNDVNEEKNMIDALRVRNGNLPVISGRAATSTAEL